MAQPSEEILITGGYVLTMDPALGDYEKADLVIKDGAIVAIGQDLTAPNARKIEASGAFVLPGFIDTHSHLYTTTMRGQFRGAQAEFFPVSSKLASLMSPSDTRIAMQLGALELIDGGITTTGDFFDNIQSPSHAEAGLSALDASGIRAVMYYGGPDRTTREPIDVDHLAHLVSSRDNLGLVRLGLAWRLPRDRNDAANWAMRQREYDRARSLGLPVQVHVSGEPAPMFDALIERDFLYEDMTVVHATDAEPGQLQALEEAGGSLALTPISEQRVGYGLTRLDRFASVDRQGLGIDGNALAGRADMFANMRLAALTISGSERDEGAIEPRALLELATRRGAEVMGLGSVVGTLTPGKRADIQVIAIDSLAMSGFGGGDPASLIVYSASPTDVRTVLIDGRIVKDEGTLQSAALPGLLEEAQRSARHLIERASDQSGAR